MTYTKLTKPSAQSYTNIGKPTTSFSIPKGTLTGMIAPPTYTTAHTVGTMYTNISKPSSQSYTNISKPT